MLFYNEKIFNSCFSYPKKYWYKNIKYIPLYFRRIHHLIKYGYDKCAFLQIDDWFIQTIKPILVDYREKHDGVPIVIDSGFVAGECDFIFCYCCPVYSECEELWGKSS